MSLRSVALALLVGWGITAVLCSNAGVAQQEAFATNFAEQRATAHALEGSPPTPAAREARQHAPAPALNASATAAAASPCPAPGPAQWVSCTADADADASSRTRSDSSSGGQTSSSDGSSDSGSNWSSRWGFSLDQRHFNRIRTAWLYVMYTLVGLTPSFTGMLFDFVYAPLLIKLGLAVRASDRFIARSWQQILWMNLQANFVSIVPLAAISALLHGEFFSPIVLDCSFAPIATLWSTTVMLLLHDAYYYFMHRAMHTNKWLYRNVHAMHHELSVMMEARTGLVITATESLLGHCVPYALALAVNVLLFTRWQDGVHYINLGVLAAPILVSSQLGMIGHSGLKYRSHLPLLALNPLLFGLLFPGTAHSPSDHQIHHERGSYNLALYFRHWDDWCGTSAPCPTNKRAPSSLLLMCYNLAYYAAVSWAIAHHSWVLAVLCSKTGLTAVAALALLPAAPGGWAWFRRLGFWDRVRGAYGCTASCSQPLDPKQRYIFAYHPHGLLSRGWWLAFGVHGKESPIADLRVSLALHKVVLSIPLVKQCLSIIGCCSADKQTLLANLGEGKQPTSIALCPGGWAEARFARTNKVLLSKRLGFVRLAVETGAQLVPVLGVGEERVGGAGANMFAAALVLPAKPVPLHVVFGTPLSHEPGEDVAAFHDRYVAALLALGKQHGVELSVV